MAGGYTHQSINRVGAMAVAEGLINTSENDTLVGIDHTKREVIEILSQVDHIFADADGTLVSDGAEIFTTDKIKLIRQLTSLGVGITIVTGKPFAEVVPLRQTLPADIPISFICEKGAYSVHFGTTGAWREFILSSAAQERSVAELREQFVVFGGALIKKYGSDKLGFGWGGSGEHKSVISIDIFAGQPPQNYLSLRGKERDAHKLQDTGLIKRVEHDIKQWVSDQQPDWRIVHIGNANTEISPGSIGKSEAIVESAEFGAARKVLILGDSSNDRGMFALRGTFPGKVLTGLVLHRKASLPLVDNADFITFGMANSNPILNAIVYARGR